MRRRRLFLSVGLIGGAVTVVLVTLVVLVKREPVWYAGADQPPGEARKALSRATLAQYSRVISVLDDPTWEVVFTADQINAFFQEDYLLLGGDENLQDGFHAPRVMIEDDRMRVGVRRGQGLWSAVMSLEVKVWKVAGAVNTLAMEIVSFQAGALPISTSTLLDNISHAARRENVDVTWYRHEKHPVAILRFQADQPRPTFQFEGVALKDGALKITGRSEESFSPMPRVVPK